MRRAFAVAILIATCVSNASSQIAVSTDGTSSPAIATAFSYTGEVVGDVAGGARRGASYAGAVSAQITVSLRRIVGWSGLQLFVFALDTHGGAPSDLAGDVQGVSNLQLDCVLRFHAEGARASIRLIAAIGYSGVITIVSAVAAALNTGLECYLGSPSIPAACAPLAEHAEVSEQPPKKNENQNRAEATAAELLGAIAGCKTA